MVATFAVCLIVSFALLALMFWVVRLVDVHGAVAFFILGPLAGAYPFISVVALPVWLAWSLTVLQMAGLSAVFARYFRGFALPQQILAAILLVVLLAIAGDILYWLFDLEFRASAFQWQ